MNYLDARFLAMDIHKRFAGKQLTCIPVIGRLTRTELVFEANVFGQDDLWEMATVAAGYNVIILTWAVTQSASTERALQVTLHISEVQKNGQPKDD